jgi:hypothetical protein
MHVLNAFRDISPLVEHILFASIPLPIVDWSNYKNLSKEEEICVQLNAQDINIILSTLSAEVQDEAIFNGQPPPESAHLIWTKLVEVYGKSKCDDALEVESMENMSIISSCGEGSSQDLKSVKPEQEVQAEATALSASTYRTCSVPYQMCSVWLRQPDNRQSMMMRLKPGGGQVMSQPQYLMILITCVSWPRKATRRLARKIKPRR